jgi:hypothetical protein
VVVVVVVVEAAAAGRGCGGGGRDRGYSSMEVEEEEGGVNPEDQLVPVISSTRPPPLSRQAQVRLNSQLKKGFAFSISSKLSFFFRNLQCYRMLMSRF